MSESTKIITMDQYIELRDCVNERFEELYNKLHDIDSRFQFLPRSGYIRFQNFVDGTLVGSCSVVSWTAKWIYATTRPTFSFGDGRILTFEASLDSKNLQTLELVNDDQLLIDWKRQLDLFCNGIYSDLLQAIKKEAEMMKYVKEEDIKKAAKIYEL